MAAPTRENPYPTAFLQHVLPDGSAHYDWLLGVDPNGKKPLISFRAKERIDQISQNKWFDLESRPDHRPEYLQIEGKLEGDRGEIKRLAKGAIFLWKEIPGGWNMMVDWGIGSVTEYEVVHGEGVLAIRRIFENQSQDPPPPLPKPKVIGDVPVDTDDSDGMGLPKKITAFDTGKKKADEWLRKPTITGTGASHVRTFHSKLTDDALSYIDQQVNEWLDDNPDLEVKLVTTTIGTFTGKVKEPHLICQVWV
tara:strand:- start:225 stop:977 length:753 start_codon:yes stop_codon:yes gene_type:complete